MATVLQRAWRGRCLGLGPGQRRIGVDQHDLGADAHQCHGIGRWRCLTIPVPDDSDLHGSFSGFERRGQWCANPFSLANTMPR